MSFRFEYSADQIPGARDYQQDSYAIRAWNADGTTGPDSTLLLVLCDGMAGHPQGALASQLASQACLRALAEQPWKTDLRDGLNEANQALAAHVANNPDCRGMGTTLLAVRITGDRLHWISVGDTSLLLLRNGELSRLNADHSMKPVLERMVETGQLDAQDAAQDPKRHMLRSAVSGGDIRLTDLGALNSALQPGDQLVLCSDGMDTLDHGQIARLLNSNAHVDPATCIQAMMQAVRQAALPGQDNATALLVRLTPNASLKESR